MNKNSLTLSVIIPAYNEEHHLKGCLDAIALQSQMPDEVIVVDNNSSDSTIKVAKQYPFVTLISEEKQGLRPTRDTGVFAAKSQLVGRIDADSQMTPDWCARVRQVFTDHPTLDALSGPCHYYDMPLGKVGLAIDRAVRKTLYAKDDTPILFGSNMVFTRKVWNEVHPDLCTDGEFFEDYDLTIHLRDMGASIGFDTYLVMGVSSRRLEDDPKQFVDNMSLHTKTFAMHGKKSKVATYGKYVYISTYPTLKLIRNLYDPVTKRMSLKKAIKTKSKPRPEGANS